jgi:hypothetical protein
VWTSARTHRYSGDSSTRRVTKVLVLASRGRCTPGEEKISSNRAATTASGHDLFPTCLRVPLVGGPPRSIGRRPPSSTWRREIGNTALTAAEVGADVTAVGPSRPRQNRAGTPSQRGDPGPMGAARGINGSCSRSRRRDPSINRARHLRATTSTPPIFQPSLPSARWPRVRPARRRLRLSRIGSAEGFNRDWVETRASVPYRCRRGTRRLPPDSGPCRPPRRRSPHSRTMVEITRGAKRSRSRGSSADAFSPMP